MVDTDWASFETPDPDHGSEAVTDPRDGNASPELLASASSATADAYRELLEGLSRPRKTDSEPHAFSLDLEPGQPVEESGWIVGIGLGIAEGPDELRGAPGTPTIELYTAEPLSTSDAVAHAVAAFGVDAAALGSDECQVRAVHTGPIDLLAHRFRMRPAPSGVSVAHSNVTAGTLGALARGTAAPRDGRLLVLSNNHVLAATNAGAEADPILQPGPYDGGTLPRDQIGLLERFVTIDFARPNRVDAATAWVDPAAVRPELVYLSAGAPRFFRHSARPRVASVGMQVGKSGRTTQLTAGFVSAVGVTIRVSMGSGRIATFVDQIAIRGSRGDFSRGGDSGSLVWTWDAVRDPVGLLFAGGGGTTFANPIDTVLSTLGIALL